MTTDASKLTVSPIVHHRRWIPKVPLRWRLALFYGVLAGSVLLLLGIVLYRQIDRFLLDNAADRLRSQAQATISRYAGGALETSKATAAGFAAGKPVALTPAPTVGATGESATAPAVVGLPPSKVEQIAYIWRTPTLLESAGRIVTELTTRDTSAVVIDPLGQIVIQRPTDKAALVPILQAKPEVIYQAESAREAVPIQPQDAERYEPVTLRVQQELAPIPPPDAERVQQMLDSGSETTYTTTDPETGARVLVMLLPLQQPPSGEVVGALQVTTSLEQADDLLAWLRMLLLIGLGGALGLSLLVGVPLTGAALRPLDKLVDTTERIAADDLTVRSQLPHGNDEIGRLAAAFDHMLARLQAGFQAQRQFVADAAHELRTPLTAISGLIELLLLGADNEDRATRRRTLATVDRDLARLTRLVNDLLALSRHDLAIPHERQRVDLAELVADIHALTAELAPDRTVILERPHEPVMVTGDPDHLRQILLNLAENARRYTPPGEQITFRVRRSGQSAEAEVIDTGPGISPEDLPRIFDRFYRGDRARARVSGGSGLGLAIARAIAQAHQGTLTVQSAAGEGASFILRLPLTAGPHNGVAASVSRVPSPNL